MKTIGEKIKELRENKGLSQRQLAVLVGCSNSAVKGWEENRHSVNSDYVYALCDELEVTPNELFGFRNFTPT